MLQSYVPLLVLLLVALGLAGVLLVVAKALGPSRSSPAKELPYECGMEPVGRPRSRSGVEFYRIAILFVVFDIEAAFFYPWAVLFRDLSCRGEVRGGICHGGSTGFGLAVMLVFLSVLALALVYVWRKRALEWQ